MTADFSANWAQQIADISGLPEYQNATIALYDPLLLPDLGEAEIYNGRARIIGINASVFVANNAGGNPTSTKRIRIQIPRGGYDDRIVQGTPVRVIDGGRNPALETLSIVVDSDVQGSNSASRTLECIVQLDQEATWDDS